jgi:leucyl aminopeptidase
VTRLVPLRGDLSDEKADLIVHFQFEGDDSPASATDPRFRESITAVLKGDGFEAKADTSLLWHGDGRQRAVRYLVQGLGRRESFGLEVLHRAAAAAGSKGSGLKVRRAGVALAPPSAWGLKPEEAGRMAAGGFLYGCYRFEKYLSSARGDGGPAELMVGTQKADPGQFRDPLRETRAVDRVLRLARDLVSEHAGYLHPRRVAEVARREARRAGIECRILGEAEMRRLGMGGMLGVARGSEHPAVLAHLRYRPRRAGSRKAPKVVLVGKGVTFDTGGISLKQADGMETMKADMSGSAAVLATMLALPGLKVPAEVHGLLMIVENMPDGRAFRPGDILRIYNGKTVEIKSTDAEGRLILADGLSWACRNLKPDYLVDLATLTGACMVALGPGCTGVMGNDERFVRRILRAAAQAGERMWQLPLYPEYREHIRSDVADVKNSGIRYGGAITAGLFLQEFVEPGVPWIHLDIAGPAYYENGYGYAPKGATGHGVRTLLQFLRSLS